MFTLFFFFHPLSLVHSLYTARAHLPLWVICLWIGLVFCCRANCSSFCHQPLQDNASVSRAVLKFRRHTDACMRHSFTSGNGRGEKYLLHAGDASAPRSRVWYWQKCRMKVLLPIIHSTDRCYNAVHVTQSTAGAECSAQSQYKARESIQFDTELFRGLNYFRFLETYPNWSLIQLPPWLTWTYYIISLCLITVISQSTN